MLDSDLQPALMFFFMKIEELQKRYTDDPLTLDQFIDLQGHDPKPVMFVYIRKGQVDERDAYDDENPPTKSKKVAKLVLRVRQWWQVEKTCVSAWMKDPPQSPGVLVAVFGRRCRRKVIAALKIDQDNWNENSDDDGITVPILDSLKDDIDAFSFRGRRIDFKAAIIFARSPDKFFTFLSTTKALRGGVHAGTLSKDGGKRGKRH